MASPNFYPKKPLTHWSSQCKVDFKWMESMVESVFQNQGRQSSASEEYLVHVAQRVSMSRNMWLNLHLNGPSPASPHFCKKSPQNKDKELLTAQKKTKVQICNLCNTYSQTQRHPVFTSHILSGIKVESPEKPRHVSIFLLMFTRPAAGMKQP